MVRKKQASLDIMRKRKENEKSEVICIREINDNIRRIFKNQALTRPLTVLNNNCQFRKRYELAFNIRNEERIKKEFKGKVREYNQRPEVKKKRGEYQRKYYQRNKGLKWQHKEKKHI